MSDTFDNPADNGQAQPQPTAEALRFAAILQVGVWVALAVLVVSFLAYLLGWPAPYVPVDLVARHWTERHDEFIAHTGQPTGWAWALRLQHPDMLNLAGVALLGLLSPLALIPLIPAALKKREYPFLAVIVLQLAILALAASGLASR